MNEFVRKAEYDGTIRALIAMIRDKRSFTHIFSGHLSTPQGNIPNAEQTLVAIDTVTIDTGENFNTTSHFYKAPFSGNYLVIGNVLWLAKVAGADYLGSIRNAVTDYEYVSGRFRPAYEAYMPALATKITKFNAGDQIGLYCFQNSGNNLSGVFGSTEAQTSLSIFYLR